MDENIKIEEDPLSKQEADEWNRKVQTLKTKKNMAGIKIDMTKDQKHRWIRARLRKAPPDRLPTSTKQKCIDMLNDGASINEAREKLSIGYQTVSKIRRELSHENLTAARP